MVPVDDRHVVGVAGQRSHVQRVVGQFPQRLTGGSRALAEDLGTAAQRRGRRIPPSVPGAGSFEAVLVDVSATSAERALWGPYMSWLIGRMKSSPPPEAM
jgi:hypothetical protein